MDFRGGPKIFMRVLETNSSPTAPAALMSSIHVGTPLHPTVTFILKSEKNDAFQTVKHWGASIKRLR